VNAGDNRLGPIIDVITSLARGDFQPEFPDVVDDPDLAAIVLGLQMLGDELAASRVKLDGRTAEMETLNNGLLRLADLSNLLLSCDTSSEAYVVLGRAVRDMYSQLSGGVYLFGASRNVVELVTSWGDLPVATTFPPTDSGYYAARVATLRLSDAGPEVAWSRAVGDRVVHRHPALLLLADGLHARPGEAAEDRVLLPPPQGLLRLARPVERKRGPYLGLGAPTVARARRGRLRREPAAPRVVRLVRRLEPFKAGQFHERRKLERHPDCSASLIFASLMQRAVSNRR